MKKSLLFSFAFAGAVLASIVLNDQSASAVSGGCYYGPGTCSVSGVGACGTNDVLPGRNTSCGGTPALNGVNTKAEFINRIINLSNNGGRVERGAKFIMREVAGTTNAAEFRRILEQPAVTLSAVNDNGSVSSWYDPGKNDFFYATYPGGWSSRPVLKLKYNGNVKSVVEVWCGNMTGTHSEIPPPPNTTLDPSINITNGPLIDNQTVRILARVSKSGPDARADWSFNVWYDENADGVKNDGTANVIATDSGANKLFSVATTDVKDQDRTINGTKNRICASLGLSGAQDNAAGGNTTIPGANTAVDCENIIQHIISARTTVKRVSGGSEVTALTVAKNEQVQFRFYFKNTGAAPANGITTKGENDAHTVVQSQVNNFAGNSAEKVIPIYTFSSATPGTYCFHPSASPWKTGQGNKDFTATSERACVTVVDQDIPPTGWISSVNTCSFSDTNHQISYGGVGDGNGGNPQGKVTTSSSSASTGVVHGPSTGGTFLRPHGVVTYYLWVENINTSGVVTGYVNVASVTTANPTPCPVTVQIDPYARLTDAGGNLITGSTVAPGMQLRTRTQVYNNGNVSTNSHWIREFWYDTDNDGAWDSGEVRVVPTSSGGPTTYSPLSNTTVSTVASGTVNGSYDRICVALRLHTVATNPNTTIVAPNPDVDCKDIVLNNIIDPDVSITGILEPGQVVRANASVDSSAPSAGGQSDYIRKFWYEIGNLDNSLDADDIEVPPSTTNGHLSYTTATTTLGQWSGTIPNNPGITYVCTSLQLLNATNVTSITAPNPALSCLGVSTKYFFQATLGDVNAIACLPAACAGPSPSISAFNLGSGSSYKGAGTQIAAFSTDSIDEFTSGNNPASFTATTPKRLTFANNGAGYGGNFTQRYQIPDYWAGPILGPDNTVNGADPLVVHRPGNILVTGSRTVSSIGVGNVSELQWVIADGDIYIDRSVTQLHGVYIAKGNIYTCTNGLSRYTTPSLTMAANCTQPLTIRGALIAGGSVKLQRTAGSLSTTPAEIIEYNPFVWMQGINPVNPLPTSTSGKLDFITTLPPIL